MYVAALIILFYASLYQPSTSFAVIITSRLMLNLRKSSGLGLSQGAASLPSVVLDCESSNIVVDLTLDCTNDGLS
jgi:hypothetical protein